MRVYIPSPLRSYTDGKSEVEGRGRTLAQLLDFLESRYPGMRFRMIDEQDQIRTHIRFFVDQEAARGLSHPIGSGQEVHIICALSGGNLVRESSAPSGAAIRRPAGVRGQPRRTSAKGPWKGAESPVEGPAYRKRQLR